MWVCGVCHESREQRCEDCGTFMRRVGIGGHCPACDEPVTIDELS